MSDTLVRLVDVDVKLLQSDEAFVIARNCPVRFDDAGSFVSLVGDDLTDVQVNENVEVTITFKWRKAINDDS